MDWGTPWAPGALGFCGVSGASRIPHPCSRAQGQIPESANTALRPTPGLCTAPTSRSLPNLPEASTLPVSCPELRTPNLLHKPLTSLSTRRLVLGYNCRVLLETSPCSMSFPGVPNVPRGHPMCRQTFWNPQSPCSAKTFWSLP